MNRRFAVALIAGAALAAAGVALAQVSPTAAVADASRPVADKEKDAARHPAELIAFAGVKPGDVVIDVWPGSGYWTRIFSKVVGPKGKVYAYVPAEISDMKSDPVGKSQALAKEPDLGNVEAISDPLASTPPPSFRDAVDVVWTFENYHDLHNPFLKGASVDGWNTAVFQVLKPGGVYIVGDHAAKAGSGLADTNDLHRIDPATVRAEVEKAGFKYDGQLTTLANPSDPHTAAVFDPSIKGKTDRFVLRFRKPQ